MDQAGVDMQVLSVAIPGVQMSVPDAASALAIATNDHLAEAVSRHPKRLPGWPASRRKTRREPSGRWSAR